MQTKMSWLMTPWTMRMTRNEVAVENSFCLPRLFASCLLIFVQVAREAELSGKTPNIIFLITDDQGFGDISSNGNPILKTPNLDRLHDEGVRFIDYHVSPTCSPTRSALLTGRHEFRNGVTHTILERERLTLAARTLPQVLKTAGYTTGIFGKWHSRRRTGVLAGQTWIRRNVHPWRRRHRPVLSRQLW